MLARSFFIGALLLSLVTGLRSTMAIETTSAGPQIEWPQDPPRQNVGKNGRADRPTLGDDDRRRGQRPVLRDDRRREYRPQDGRFQRSSRLGEIQADIDRQPRRGGGKRSKNQLQSRRIRDPGIDNP